MVSMRAFSRHLLRHVVCAGLVLVSLNLPGFSQETVPNPALSEASQEQQQVRVERVEARKKARDELQGIKESIAISAERAGELRKEINALSGNQTELSAALIASGQRVRLAEIEVNDSEDRLTDMLETEAEIRRRLDGKQSNIAALLAALQRIAKYPPPALIINPDDTLTSARSAMLLSAVLPQMRTETRIVMDDLSRLSAVKAEAVEERNALGTGLSTLLEERLRVATLLSARKQGISRSNDALAEEEGRAAALAEEAGSLNELIAALEREISAVSLAAEAARRAGRNPGTLSPLEKQIALASTDRQEPAIPFSQTRGIIQLPVIGVLIGDFGVRDGFGGTAQGITVTTRIDAQVVTPIDGWVVYKGPYLNYGQIILLNVGEGYHVLLAGLAEVSVDLGQFVLLGEPVGRMGSQNRANNLGQNAGNSAPTLYIEFRKDGSPIDSATWWAAGQIEKDRG